MMNEDDKKTEEKYDYFCVSLNVVADVGVKGDTIEYMYHYDHDGTRSSGQDLDAKPASEWREVKKDIVACRKAAEKGNLHDDIVGIEKVWHDVANDKMWCGTASLFEWTDYGDVGDECDVPDCNNFVQEGQGVSTYEDWSNCCEECYDSYRNGDWVREVDVRL